MLDEQHIITITDATLVASEDPRVELLISEQDAPVVVEVQSEQVVLLPDEVRVVDEVQQLYVIAVAAGGTIGVSVHAQLAGLDGDDHLQYHTDARGDARYSLLGHDHDAAYEPLGAVATHEAAPNPHAQYLTQAEGDALYSVLAHGHDHGALTGLGDDDHPQYHTDTRGDARYSLLAHNHAHADLANLQGGTTGEYYHLTSAQHTDLTDGGATTLHKHDHGGLDGLSDNDHPQYLLVADIDDAPVNGEIAQPISSNWAFDHLAAADPHPGYVLESAYTAADVLSKLLTADGSGSGLDADLFDGQSGAYYLARANHTGTQLATTISDFSEAVDDRVAALIQDGTGITWVYDDINGTLTPTVSVTGYTDEMVDDRVDALIQDGTGISWVYDDVGNTLTPTVTLAPFSTTNLAEGSNLYFTDERVDDRVAALLVEGTGIDLAYVDGSGTLTITVDLSELSTSTLPEGSNLYFTDERAQDAVGGIVASTATVTMAYSDATPNITANVIAVPVVDAAADTTTFPLLVGAATGNLPPLTDAGLSYNASTNALTTTTFIGALTGNADTATTAVTVTAAAQPAITSLGTLTILNVDNLRLDGNTLSATTGAVNITPVAGSAIVLDGTISVDAGVVTGATSISSTTFVGALTGNASTATALATPRTIGNVSFDGTANIVPETIAVVDSTDATSFIAMFDSATGNLQPKTDAGLTYAATTGILTATGFSGPLNGTVGATSAASGSFTTLNASVSATLVDASIGGASHKALHTQYTAADTDITGLISGSTTGALVEAPAQMHYVVGLRENDAGDSFAIISGGGNYSTDSIYDTLVAKFVSNGTVFMNAGTVQMATVDINGGAIDGTAVGAATPAAGTFTTLASTGNTTIGDASGDTLTINAGTWTLGSTFTATRAAGALPAGSSQLHQFSTSASGDAGGTTSLFSTYRFGHSFTGTNAASSIFNLNPIVTTSHTGVTLGSAVACLAQVFSNSSGLITNAYGFYGLNTANSTGDITNSVNYIAAGVTFASSGAVTTSTGFQAGSSLGHATLVTNALGFDCGNITTGPTFVVGYRSQVASGAGRWGFYDSGGANHALIGFLRLGSVVAPTVALDVTGAVLVSTTLGVTGNATFDANVTLGNASGDTLTINAGTWTIGNNYTAARAVGAAAAGAFTVGTWNTTASADAGGTTDINAYRHAATFSGANSYTAARLHFDLFTISASAGTVTNAVLNRSAFTLSGAANITNAQITTFGYTLSAAGNITTAVIYDTVAPTLSSTGAITNHTGFRAANLGHATLVTNAIGFDAINMTAAATLTASFRSAQNSGTGVWGYLQTGSANNAWAGNSRFGSGSVAPVATVDITGTLTTSGTATFNGNVVLGDASGDTLTTNAGTWTIAQDFTASRSSGTVAAGVVNAQAWNNTFTGDAGGTTDYRAWSRTSSVSGANNITSHYGEIANLVHNSTGNATATVAKAISLSLSNTGSVTTFNGVQAVATLSNSGNLTSFRGFNVGAPTLSSTGAITTITGFLAGNLGHATLVTNAIGFDAANMTASATLTVSFRSAQNSGTGVWGFQHTGTANNAFNGNTRLGGTTAPTVALDVTGEVLVSDSVTSLGCISKSSVGAAENLTVASGYSLVVSGAYQVSGALRVSGTMRIIN